MNRFILFLIATIATLLFCSTTVSAQDIPDDDGEEIIIVIDDSSQGNGHGRSISSVPFSVTLYRSLSYLEVNFIIDVGDVTITLINTLTGNLSLICTAAHYGSACVPVPSDSGLWQIHLSLESGGNYIGYYYIYQ